MFSVFNNIRTLSTDIEVWPIQNKAQIALRIFMSAHRDCEKRLLASLCPSVCLHGKTQVPLDGMLCKLIFEFFFQKCRGNSISIERKQE
jgi:hypothetical protein